MGPPCGVNVRDGDAWVVRVTKQLAKQYNFSVRRQLARLSLFGFQCLNVQRTGEKTTGCSMGWAVRKG